MSTRYYADLVAIPMHLGFLIGTGVANAGRWGSLEGGLLLAMEVIALLAHVWYPAVPDAAAFRDEVNVYKWGEYSISATLGGLAVLASSDEWPWRVPVAIAALGVAEQATSYTLDLSVTPGCVQSTRRDHLDGRGGGPDLRVRGRRLVLGRHDRLCLLLHLLVGVRRLGSA